MVGQGIFYIGLFLLIHSPICYNMPWNGRLIHKATKPSDEQTLIPMFLQLTLKPVSLGMWLVHRAHLFSRYFLSVCMIQIQTSFQINRKRRWTVNRAKGNIIVRGKLKHGTQHGSGGILNGLNTRAEVRFMEDWASDNGLLWTKSKASLAISAFFLLLFIKCEAK